MLTLALIWSTMQMELVLKTISPETISASSRIVVGGESPASSLSSGRIMYKRLVSLGRLY